MSRISKTICDCCGNELTGGTKLNKCLFLTIISGAQKTRVDYCYECGKRISAEIIKVVQGYVPKRGDSDG